MRLVNTALRTWPLIAQVKQIYINLYQKKTCLGNKIMFQSNLRRLPDCLGESGSNSKDRLLTKRVMAFSLQPSHFKGLCQWMFPLNDEKCTLFPSRS